MPFLPAPPARLLRLAALVLLVLGPSGCVRSRLHVTSDPPGADVTINGTHLGATPVDHPITWYWYYEFEAKKDGFETAKAQEKVSAPPWLWPGFDMLMEAMPFNVVDEKDVHLTLEPKAARPAPEFAMK